MLDQFVARGGKLILLAEGYAVGGGQWSARPHPDDDPLTRALAAWGLRLERGLVVQKAWRRWGLAVDGTQVLAPYPFFLGPTGAENQVSPVAGSLGRVVLPYASPVAFTPDAPVGVERTPLLGSGPAWVLEGEVSVHPLQQVQTAGEPAPRLLAAGVRGRLPSAWAGHPSPVRAGARAGQADPLAIPLAEPTAPGCVVLVGDADFLRPQWLQHGEGDLLLLNLVDWCLGAGSLVSVRARQAQIPLTGKGTSLLGLQRDDLVQGLNLVLLPLAVLLFGLGRLAAQRRRRGERATALRDALAEAS